MQQPCSCMLPKHQSWSLVSTADCTWQKQLMAMVRTDSPSTLFLFFQNPMSFLKAKKSNTECSSETAHVRARKIGLPSSRTRLNSSDSPSPIAPQDCCSKPAKPSDSQAVAANRFLCTAYHVCKLLRIKQQHVVQLCMTYCSIARQSVHHKCNNVCTAGAAIKSLDTFKAVPCLSKYCSHSTLLQIGDVLESILHSEERCINMAQSYRPEELHG